MSRRMPSMMALLGLLAVAGAIIYLTAQGVGTIVRETGRHSFKHFLEATCCG